MNTGATVLLSLGLGALTIAMVLANLAAKEVKDSAAQREESAREPGLKSRFPAAAGRPMDS